MHAQSVKPEYWLLSLSYGTAHGTVNGPASATLARVGTGPWHPRGPTAKGPRGRATASGTSRRVKGRLLSGRVTGFKVYIVPRVACPDEPGAGTIVCHGCTRLRNLFLPSTTNFLNGVGYAVLLFVDRRMILMGPWLHFLPWRAVDVWAVGMIPWHCPPCDPRPDRPDRTTCWMIRGNINPRRL